MTLPSIGYVDIYDPFEMEAYLIETLALTSSSFGVAAKVQFSMGDLSLLLQAIEKGLRVAAETAGAGPPWSSHNYRNEQDERIRDQSLQLLKLDWRFAYFKLCFSSLAHAFVRTNFVSVYFGTA